MGTSEERGRGSFFGKHNESTRIDVFDELSEVTLAALHSFCRRMGAPQLLHEVILPMLQDGDTRLFAAVRDRPWPPWGLGARHVSALCHVQAIAPESYAIGPVYATDEDLTNVGMLSALYKEVLETLITNPAAEVSYLVADGSVLAHHVLTSLPFRREDDVFLTEEQRYHTYRAPAADLLVALGLKDVAIPDLLAHDVPPDVLIKNALFHQTIYLGSKAEWAVDRVSELIRVVRGGHAGKPGGVPQGTGRFGFPELVNPADPFFVTLESFLGEQREALLEFALKNESKFKPSTVLVRGKPAVNEKFRRARTFDKLGSFERIFAGKLKEALAPVLQRLQVPSFPVGEIEVQITMSGDGDYYRMHQDDDAAERLISFVYFFHREPRRFSGGELRLFDAEVIDGKRVPTDRSQLLSPRQDTIVFFPSETEHEILPVRVPSRAFADGRFTVNGWIHRQGKTKRQR